MKKLIYLVTMLTATVFYSQKYSNDQSDEVYLAVTPISISKNLEINQAEIGWRRGYGQIGVRVGVDNPRVLYLDVKPQGNIYINNWLDITIHTAIGKKFNYVKKDSQDEGIYADFGGGFILKPTEKMQIFTQFSHFDQQNFINIGLILKFRIN